ncbi:hypothetical protein ABFA25_07715 [Mycobacterium lepromatosis]|uniref:hypothetical protein n=1 Tax=Mycobacterium lepromatosis TaxID=480418 RepID=UPI0012E0ADAC
MRQAVNETPFPTLCWRNIGRYEHGLVKVCIPWLSTRSVSACNTSTVAAGIFESSMGGLAQL